MGLIRLPHSAQAIDLMDEAGSRTRIRAYHARQPGGTADALAAVKELHEVQDAKAQAVKVGGPPKCCCRQRFRVSYYACGSSAGRQGYGLLNSTLLQTA